ncbi:hypothetical protein C6P40_001311 [Pichia californica]|uniref:LST4 longin domain-containing protein n=1 Tax=Pichia californica TaxID=460514 RepID=A0A9P6WL97_9ASCO|nr:hypothetical protein C6P40_001311 [[Candida] californica]
MIGNLFRKRESVYNSGVPPLNSTQNSNFSSSSSSSSSFPSNCNQSAYDQNSSRPYSSSSSSTSSSPIRPSASSYYNPQVSPLSININQSSKLSSGLSDLDNNTINDDANKVNPQDSGISMPSLYGTSKTTPSSTFKLSEKLQGFRMVIIQDAGIRKKQPLFDSAVPYNQNFSIMQQKLNKKIHHSINELSLFMFGCYGMPMSENNMTTKIHYLPALSNMHSSVLITRLFSLDSSFKLKPHKMSNDSSDWDPHPLLETDELPLYENSSIRFSIGLIIPVSSSIESVRDEITENWLQTSDSLITMQNLIVSKLKLIYNTQHSPKRTQQANHSSLGGQNFQSNITGHSFNVVSQKFGFSIYSLQTEMEIYQKLSSLLSQLISLSEVPRLFIDLKHSNQLLIDWASTLSLWLELKDGRTHRTEHESLDLNNSNGIDDYNNNGLFLQGNSNHSIKFLASLLSIFLPIKDELFVEPEKCNSELSKLRIVIGTGNPAVSQKLVFILVGILGYEKFSQLYEAAQKLPKQVSHDYELQHSSTIPIPISRPEDYNTKKNILTRNNSLIIDTPSYSQSIETSTKTAPLRIQHSPSISTVSANVHGQRIPVPMMTRTSSYASLQNISTSYGANIPISGGSQTPSSSWRNNFGSLMDLWKNSITSSPTTSQFSKSPRTETPSPSIEYDEFPWQLSARKSACMSPTPSFVSINPSLIQQNSLGKSSKLLNIGNYIASNKYNLSRSAINLIPTRFENIVDRVKLDIFSIMNSDFDMLIDDLDHESVVDIDMKSKLIDDNGSKNFSCATAIPLPLLVGYVSQFRPEFGMMCCPNKSLHDETFVHAMKDDLKNPLVNNSSIYLINLGMRKVNLLEYKKKIYAPNHTVSDVGKNADLPLYTSKPNISNLKSTNIFEDTTKSKSKSKSNLSKTIQESFELKQKTIFAPEISHDYGVIDDNASKINNDSTLSHRVDLLDRILEKIALTINNFLAEVKSNCDDCTDNSENEDICCNTIRELIDQLLDIGRSN